MVEIICLFFPAIFSVYFIESILKKELSLKNSIGLWAVNVLGINTIIFAIKYFVFKTEASPLSDINGMTINTAFKYLVLAIPLSAIFAVLEALFCKNSRKSRKK